MYATDTILEWVTTAMLSEFTSQEMLVILPWILCDYFVYSLSSSGHRKFRRPSISVAVLLPIAP